MSRNIHEISKKVQKSLITPLPAPPRSGTVPAGRDYETITRITNTLKNKEKSVESFLQICGIRDPKVFFQSSHLLT
jgi:hypothetical protein